MNDVTRYRAAPFRAVRAREGNRLVTALPSGERVLLPDPVFAILERLKSFLTLDEHAQTLAQQPGRARDQSAAIRSALADLRGKELLLSEAEFLNAAVASEPAVPPVIATIGVPTRRSPVLERCLESFAANARAHGHPVTFVVADDAPDLDLSAPLAALSQRLNSPIRCFGRREIEGLVGQLSDAGVDSAVARFGLLGEAPGLPPGIARTTGACRNVLMLATCGDAFLSVDDDTICQLTPSPSSRPELAFHSQGSPAGIWFEPDLPAPPAASFDLLERMGRSLGPAVRAAEPLAGNEFDQGTLEKLITGRAQVRLVQAGIAGDAATTSPSGWITIGGPSRERMTRDETRYRKAMESRRIFAAADCETVSDSEHCMAVCLALDNRAPFPPFPPLGRDQDGIFGTLLRVTDPLSFTLHQPFAITHEPAKARQFPTGALSHAGMILNSPIRLLLEGCGQDVAAQLEEYAALPPRDFAHLLVERRLQSLSRVIAYYETILASHSARPTFWARDMQLLIRECERAMTDRDVLQIDEPGAAVAIEDPAGVCQTYVRWFAALLRAWPEMRHRSR